MAISKVDQVTQAGFIASAIANKATTNPLSVSIPTSAPLPFTSNGLQAGENQALDSQSVFQHADYIDILPATGVAKSIANLVVNGTVIYYGYQVLGSALTSTVTIYDSTAASGTVMEVVATPVVGKYKDTIGTKCQTGLFISLSAALSAGQTFRVFFRAG